ncbi:ArnT family glycosyltransferase [Niabella beijingensis]|uniref:ArnT family glycosyltransferase n=1 Tax=Niabella beijingensis TaxID=2872700 RepID=UPI001CBE1433|nr:glycosyltransferase family 39 protein [Niabella beijingensis]MBZ4189409.1 glycosyltransferase family 39 protein [Niabella beijingensis]
MTNPIKLTLLIICLLKLVLHLVADYHSGFQGDELLHIETGKHLAFGYMEFPPLIGVLAFIQNLFHSHSVFVHHIFSHLAGVIILIIIARVTIELGGNNRAVFFVLLGLIIAPGFERSQQLFQPVVFSQLFWVLGFYQLLRFIKYLDKKSLWLLTLFCALGFLSKYDAVFFIFGLTSLLIFKRTRNALIQNKFWWNIFVFSICVLPNTIWQISNNYPAFQMFSRLYETQLESLSRTANIKKLLIDINPITTLLLFLPGIYYLAISKNKSVITPLAVAIGLSFLSLLYKNGKAYYFFPIVLTVLPFGAVFMERYLFIKREWVFYPVTVLMLLAGVLVPFGMPVYSFNRYLSKIYPFGRKDIDGGAYGVKYDEYYTKEKWRTTMQELKQVYDNLPTSEKENCLIWGKHYGQAGAVNLFRDQYNLPESFSYHGSFYTWSPTGQMPHIVIALSYRIGNYFEPYFGDIEKVRTIYNPYSDNDEELYQYIYVCKRPNQNFDEMKEQFRGRIFE